MLLLKPKGIISLLHCANEGSNAGYTGFHHWDFFTEGSDFCIAGKNKQNYTNVTKMLLPDFVTDVKMLKCREREDVQVIVRHIGDM
jgi:hypothetical protein